MTSDRHLLLWTLAGAGVLYYLWRQSSASAVAAGAVHLVTDVAAGAQQAIADEFQHDVIDPHVRQLSCQTAKQNYDLVEMYNNCPPGEFFTGAYFPIDYLTARVKAP